MDLNLIKSKLGALQQKNSGGTNKDLSQVIWKPSPGKHSVRIVPSAYNKSNPFKEMFFHYGIGKRTMVSLVNFGEKDPIVEFADQLRKSSDKENWQMAKKLSPKMRVFVPVVVRGEEDKGVRLWEFGKQIYMELLAIAEDEDVGDYTDPVEGRDLTIETTDPATNGTGFNQSKVRVRTKITPLSADSAQVQAWLTTQPDPTTLFKKYAYDEMKSSLLEWLNPGEETETPAEEPAKAPVAEAPKAPGYSLNAKPKVDVDKAFDDLFSEESNDLPF
jgi:hypothetical protein